jgi:hypothetical protein
MHFLIHVIPFDKSRYQSYWEGSITKIKKERSGELFYDVDFIDGDKRSQVPAHVSENRRCVFAIQLGCIVSMLTIHVALGCCVAVFIGDYDTVRNGADNGADSASRCSGL